MKEKFIIFTSIVFIAFITSCYKEVNPIFHQDKKIENELVSGNGEISFERIIGGRSYDNLESVKQTQEGDFIFCGYTTFQSSLNTADVLLIKTNSLGETKWISLNPNDNNEYGEHVFLTDENEYTVFVKYDSLPRDYTNNSKYKLIKYDNNGFIIKEVKINLEDDTRISLVKQTSDLGFIMLGEVNGNEFVKKIDVNGTVKWENSFQYPMNLTDIEITSQENYVVSGYDNDDILIHFINKSGVVTLTKIIIDTCDIRANSILETQSGFIIGGYKSSISAVSGMIIKLDNNGEYLWSADYGHHNIMFVDQIIMTNDSNYIAIGTEHSEDLVTSNCFLKLNSRDGAMMFLKDYLVNDKQYFNDIQQLKEGGFIAVGYGEKYGNQNAYIVKKDKNGN